MTIPGDQEKISCLCLWVVGEKNTGMSIGACHLQLALQKVLGVVSKTFQWAICIKCSCFDL